MLSALVVRFVERRNRRLAAMFARVSAGGGDQVLVLLFRGRRYLIVRPSSKGAAELVRMLAAAPATPEGGQTDGRLVLDGDVADASLEALLGDQYGRMLLDGVPPEVVEHAAETVLAWLRWGRDVALCHWECRRPELYQLAVAGSRGMV